MLEAKIAKIKRKKLPKNRKITQPGVYFVDQDIVIDAFPEDQLHRGIEVIGSHVEDVVIDFQGHTLKQSSINHVSFGLFVNGTRNITIKNAVIEGFYFGIYVVFSQNCTIKNCVLKQTYYAAIRVFSDSALIENNLIENLNFNGNKITNDNYIIGILVQEGEFLIRNNKLINDKLDESNIDRKIEHVGILVSANITECVIQNNFLANEFILGISYAVWAGENSKLIVCDNQFINYNVHLAALDTSNISLCVSDKVTDKKTFAAIIDAIK